VPAMASKWTVRKASSVHSVTTTVGASGAAGRECNAHTIGCRAATKEPSTVAHDIHPVEVAWSYLENPSFL